MKTIAHIILAVFAAVVVFGTLLPLWGWEKWWVRILDFPRLQIACLGVMVVLLWIPLWKSAHWWQIAAWIFVLAAVVYQGFRIFPFTALAREQMADAEASPRATMSILLSNVLMENHDAAQLLALVEKHNPDIVFTLEPDQWWARALEPIAAHRPHIVSRPLDNTYGMILYSKFPLRDTIMRELTEPGVPSIRTTMEIGDGVSITFHGLHPPPPVPTFAEDSLPRDAELVLVAREVEKSPGPTIVAGDLNDVAWSDTTALFQKLSGLLDPRRGRGMYNSFHAKYFFMRWPLDHVFFSEDFLLIDIQRLPAIGSDHFPILVRVAYAPREQAKNDPPLPADAEAREEGAEKVRDEREGDR
jgi:endonuclease/exonuclease/phosphatase (EEP) superfamily protein YafD